MSVCQGIVPGEREKVRQAREEWYSSLQRATRGGVVLGSAGVIHFKHRSEVERSGDRHRKCSSAQGAKVSLVSLVVLEVDAEKKQVLFLF